MHAMPVMLTNICSITDSALMVSTKWPMNDRNTPTQNTASDCSPHLRSGSRTGHLSPCQSSDKNRVTTNSAAAKCATR